MIDETNQTDGVNQMKYIVYGLDGDPQVPMLNVCANNTDMGSYVVSVVGVGNPYYAFQSLPSAILLADSIGANFNGAPLASADWQTNRNTVASQYANPAPTGVSNDGTNKVWVES